jgi:hypothetical protein
MFTTSGLQDLIQRPQSERSRKALHNMHERKKRPIFHGARLANQGA